MDETIKIDHLTKIEGHGSLVINLRDRRVEDVRISVFESSRFFESFLVGRRYDEVPELTSRICGFCHIAHSLTALKAIERALGFEPSEQTVDLRNLLCLAGTLQSHLLHLYFFVVPDYLGFESAFSLAKERPDDVRRALAMKKTVNNLIEAVMGRVLHNVAGVVGGFTSVPARSELMRLLKQFEKFRDDAVATAKLVGSFSLPDFEREVKYLALCGDGKFPFYEGDKISDHRGTTFPVEDYMKNIKETVLPYSTAKRSTFVDGSSLFVGALARININGKKLSDGAKEIMSELGLKFPSYNPFFNNVAQAIELVHCADEIISILEKLADGGVNAEKPSIKVKAGEGVAATEAPRGTLYHHYIIDGRGRVKFANLIMPTNQNLINIEDDLREIVPRIVDLPRQELILTAEKLVRAYDPCISCSTHFLEVKFV